MAMDQAEHDRRRREKSAKHQEEDLRLKVRPGTKQAPLELMEWASIDEQGEAITLMVHRIHELGPEAALHFISAPRHEIVISKIVAQHLDQFRIGRELRAPDLLLGEDPNDMGLIIPTEAMLT